MAGAVNIDASSADSVDLSIGNAADSTSVKVSDGAAVNLIINNVRGNRIVARQNDYSLNVPLVDSNQLSVETQQRLSVVLLDPNEYIYKEGPGPVDWGEIDGTVTNQTDLINYIAGELAGIPMVTNWGRIEGVVTDQQDLVDYIAGEIGGLTLNTTWGRIEGTLTDQQDLVSYIASVLPNVPFQTISQVIDAINASGRFALTVNIETSGSIYTGGASPVSSAALQADSTTKGFLPPRMTSNDVNNIQNPADGLIVFDTTNNVLVCWANGMWNPMF